MREPLLDGERGEDGFQLALERQDRFPTTTLGNDKCIEFAFVETAGVSAYWDEDGFQLALERQDRFPTTTLGNDKCFEFAFVETAGVSTYSDEDGFQLALERHIRADLSRRADEGVCRAQ